MPSSTNPDLIPRILAALDTARTYIQSHGGNIRFCGITDGVVEIEFLDACSGCPLTEVTLRLHIERVLREKAPEIVGVKVKNG